ncbi:hypothetical protein SARC_00871 [Sphaeroforma arctica JP610]|uniref:Uncharacterized protein n=1 Tax=Sphaeroforma arctica JP610 TaxID=667725 RepID=A0A0L0GFC7_9EUKA|nr:hypothetical protein SARC_00871 [Sphaeroforma arctica JP610]KNC86978.1 hypothetical protein SARC_00871 [Sphaeroforma arctica JP610]|eukprot:XP_014160880.1 hypothetical protein SARC_00871 [Sphaeroforma arctica JP610]
MAKEARAHKPDPQGVLFPKDRKGGRSTQDAGREAYAAAIGAMEIRDGANCTAEKGWRYGYAKHVMQFVELSLKSPEHAVKGAQAGLDFVHDHFEFKRGDKIMSISEAMSSIKDSFETGYIKGEKGGEKVTEFEIPYKGRMLKGRSLCDQVDKWVLEGVIEPDCGEYIKAAATTKTWLDLSDKYFVLLGAGSAMGPFIALTKLGANIIALDLDRPGIWERLITTVRKSNATITFPLKKAQAQCTSDTELFANAGCNLFSETPEIKNWLINVHPSKAFIIGAYAYLDGELHVRVSLAMDAIIAGVCEKRPEASAAYLMTPTHIYGCQEETAQASRVQYSAGGAYNNFFHFLNFVSGGKLCQPSTALKVYTDVHGEPVNIIDSLSLTQGPNYALAKQIQVWRAVVEKTRGHGVSSNVAPTTATASVLYSKSLKWAMDGYHRFRPVEIMQQETSNAVMCALLINDVNNKECNAHKDKKLAHPWDLFNDGQFHGGMYRCGYAFGSTGEAAVLSKFLGPILDFMEFFWSA